MYFIGVSGLRVLSLNGMESSFILNQATRPIKTTMDRRQAGIHRKYRGGSTLGPGGTGPQKIGHAPKYFGFKSKNTHC